MEERQVSVDLTTFRLPEISMGLIPGAGGTVSLPARIGRQGAERRRDHIRGDFTCWLSEPLLPPERVLLQRLEELRLQLNRDAFLGLFELDLH